MDDKEILQLVFILFGTLLLLNILNLCAIAHLYLSRGPFDRKCKRNLKQKNWNHLNEKSEVYIHIIAHTLLFFRIQQTSVGESTAERTKTEKCCNSS